MKIINTDNSKRYKKFDQLKQGDAFYWKGNLTIKLEKDPIVSYNSGSLSDGGLTTVYSNDTVEVPHKAEIHVTREED